MAKTPKDFLAGSAKKAWQTPEHLFQMCTKKRAYNRNRAKYLAVKSSQRTGDDIRPYKCWYKNHWHLGHHVEKVPSSRGAQLHDIKDVKLDGIPNISNA